MFEHVSIANNESIPNVRSRVDLKLPKSQENKYHLKKTSIMNRKLMCVYYRMYIE